MTKAELQEQLDCLNAYSVAMFDQALQNLIATTLVPEQFVVKFFELCEDVERQKIKNTEKGLW